VDLTGVRTLRSLRDALQLYLRETEQLVVQQQHTGFGRNRLPEV
jgi:hypothetical protein